VTAKRKMKRSRSGDLTTELIRLIENFEAELRSRNRTKVLALIPIFHGLRELGKALLPAECASAARDRILYYLCKYPRTVIMAMSCCRVGHSGVRSPCA
jgi:hypothetical protein